MEKDGEKGMGFDQDNLIAVTVRAIRLDDFHCPGKTTEMTNAFHLVRLLICVCESV